MKRAYEDWTPTGASMRDVLRAESICDEYRAAGYTLTLRQLYYQFVARGLIANNDKSYNRLGSLIDRGRKAGYLDWSMIEDRTRNLQALPHWDTPGDVIAAAKRSYGNDTWSDQPTRVEVWVEKEALAGIVERAASAWDCAWFSCRGYVSQSEMWNAAQRLGGYIAEGQRVVVLHLGDHDPSGIDMSRDIRDRLERFIIGDAGSRLGWGSTFVDAYDEDRESCLIEMGQHFDAVREGLGFGTDPDYYTDTISEMIEVRRIALTIEQVRQFNPPPNPAKMSDSRAGD